MAFVYLEYVILFRDGRDFRTRKTHRQIIDDASLSRRDIFLLAWNAINS